MSPRPTRPRAQDRNAALACRQGLGTLIAKLGEQLPLSLSTPANRLCWSNRDVIVNTPKGKIVARAGIVTVSSNVLAAGNDQVRADLPKRHSRCGGKAGPRQLRSHRAAIAGQSARLWLVTTSSSSRASRRGRRCSSPIWDPRRCARSMSRARFGRDLSAQGEQAMVAFAKEWLTKLFGSDAAAAVKKSSATRWNAAPFAQGAMSVAAPGTQSSRKILTEPIGSMYLRRRGRARTLWGTIDGAWESGERAAEAALRRIGALTEIEPDRRDGARSSAPYSTAPRRATPGAPIR